MNERVGRCPACSAPGVVGRPCPERACARQRVHFVPEDAARAALAEPPTSREPLIGLFVGDYLVVGRLGKGGFGRVLLALQRPLYRLQAAVKLLERDGLDAAATARVAARFEHEAAALAVLQHPNIVRLLHYGRYLGRPYLAMELIPGARTLRSEMNRLGFGHEGIDASGIQHILTQILNGLESAHARDIIHRDVKPENIMLQAVVGDPWHVKIVDFGLAKEVAQSRETSLVLGTVTYMAPEQIEARNLGPWTDVYAVGAIAFELMTGVRAFAGRSAKEILRAKLDPAFDPLADVASLALPAVVEQFLRRALARAPEDRFQGADEVRRALAPVFDCARAAIELGSEPPAASEEIERARLRREKVQLEREREALTSLRVKLEAERQELVAERARLETRRVGWLADAEHAALGDTAALGRPGAVVEETTEVTPRSPLLPVVAVVELERDGAREARTGWLAARPAWLAAAGAMLAVAVVVAGAAAPLLGGGAERVGEAAVARIARAARRPWCRRLWRARCGWSRRGRWGRSRRRERRPRGWRRRRGRCGRRGERCRCRCRCSRSASERRAGATGVRGRRRRRWRGRRGRGQAG
ncbi:MAG: protein kinase [Deltaproteobacteria bacterium]|nr:protein kinase [Deltaproteobacteria bacterium]